MIISLWTWGVTNYIHSHGRRGAGPFSTLRPLPYASKAPMADISRLSLTQQHRSRISSAHHVCLGLTSRLPCEGSSPPKQRTGAWTAFPAPMRLSQSASRREARAPLAREWSLCPPTCRRAGRVVQDPSDASTTETGASQMALRVVTGNMIKWEGFCVDRKIPQGTGEI